MPRTALGRQLRPRYGFHYSMRHPAAGSAVRCLTALLAAVEAGKRDLVQAASTSLELLGRGRLSSTYPLGFRLANIPGQSPAIGRPSPWPFSAGSRWVFFRCAIGSAERGWTSKVDDAEPGGVRDGVGAAHGIKLVEKRTDVELRGVNRYTEPPSDDFVRGSFGEQR